jgi:hypothetical protein
MDEHVPRSITTGLRLRNVDVLTVQEDGRTGFPDSICGGITKYRQILTTIVSRVGNLQKPTIGSIRSIVASE